MKFCLMLRAYNRYGGHLVLSFIPEFLLEGAGNYGPAVNDIEFTLLLAHPGPPRNTLGKLFEDFIVYCARAPHITFRRSREKVEIAVASEVMDAFEWKKGITISPERFKVAVLEVVDGLQLLKRAVKAVDDFDVDAFLSHCSSRLAALPKSDAELETTMNVLREREAKRRMEPSPWQLGIEWRDCHSDAPQILNDPFFWSQIDDFAPHGNDTGADLLSDYREWLQRDRGVSDPLAFYEEQVSGWYERDGSIPEILRESLNEAAVAVAFAEIKLRGACRPSVAALAKAALDRQRLAAEAASDTERLARIGQLGATLDRVRRE